MAYVMHYWENGHDSETHLELKSVILKSVNEIQSLALPHNRPKGTTLITVDRSDKQSNIEKIIWEAK